MKPFFIFRFFPFFCQIAKRKVLIFCSQCFAYYTTTRENRELRLLVVSRVEDSHYTTTRENRELRHQAGLDLLCVDYTTTRENRELRPVGSEYLLRQNYTTTRENRELRLLPPVRQADHDYTTTRENRELRLLAPLRADADYYTTTRENREPRQCDYIEEINFHHIVILAAAGSCAREGRIEHKKENTGTVLNMEENLSTGYTQSTTAR